MFCLQENERDQFNDSDPLEADCLTDSDEADEPASKRLKINSSLNLQVYQIPAFNTPKSLSIFPTPYSPATLPKFVNNPLNLANPLALASETNNIVKNLQTRFSLPAKLSITPVQVKSPILSDTGEIIRYKKNGEVAKKRGPPKGYKRKPKLDLSQSLNLGLAHNIQTQNTILTSLLAANNTSVLLPPPPLAPKKELPVYIPPPITVPEGMWSIQNTILTSLLAANNTSVLLPPPPLALKKELPVYIPPPITVPEGMWSIQNTILTSLLAANNTSVLLPPAPLAPKKELPVYIPPPITVPEGMWSFIQNTILTSLLAANNTSVLLLPPPLAPKKELPVYIPPPITVPEGMWSFIQNTILTSLLAANNTSVLLPPPSLAPKKELPVYIPPPITVPEGMWSFIQNTILTSLLAANNTSVLLPPPSLAPKKELPVYIPPPITVPEGMWSFIQNTILTSLLAANNTSVLLPPPPLAPKKELPVYIPPPITVPEGVELVTLDLDPEDWFPSEPYKMTFSRKKNPKWKLFPFRCEHCFKGYRVASTLLTHAAERHGTVPKQLAIPCPCCPHVSTCKKHHKKHLESHGGRRHRIFCVYCLPPVDPTQPYVKESEKYPFDKCPQYWYASEESLRLHKKRKHPYAGMFNYNWHCSWKDTQANS